MWSQVSLATRTVVRFEPQEQAEEQGSGSCTDEGAEMLLGRIIRYLLHTVTTAGCSLPAALCCGSRPSKAEPNCNVGGLQLDDS
jgi:hypothetical protein